MNRELVIHFLDLSEARGNLTRPLFLGEAGDLACQEDHLIEAGDGYLGIRNPVRNLVGDLLILHDILYLAMVIHDSDCGGTCSGTHHEDTTRQ